MMFVDAHAPYINTGLTDRAESVEDSDRINSKNEQLLLL